MPLRRLIIPLLLLFIIIATTYNALIPLGEGPDEPGHMAYVLFLARDGRLPVQRAEMAQSDVPGEGHQPPLAYLVMLPAVLWLPPEAQQVYLTAQPQFVWNGGSEPAAFVRSSREYWPWQSVTLAWHLARGISTLLGAFTLFCIWGAARDFLRACQTAGTGMGRLEGLALLAAALVAVLPQFLFTAALVTNDMLLVALSAALFWVGVRATSGPQTVAAGWRFALLAGVLLGLALLTKQSAVLLVPLLVWCCWRVSGGHWRQTLALTGGLFGVALLVAGWWFVRNWQLYGDPLGLAKFQASYATQPFAWNSLDAWSGALWQLYRSFWAYFGWLTLPPPAWALMVYTVLVLLALAGLLRVGLFARPAACAPWPLLVLLPLLALAWTVSFALVAGLVAWQGRMLFPALPALGLLLALGLTAWGQRRFVAGGVVVAGLALVAWSLPFAVIAPAYEWHTLPAAVARQQGDGTTYARFAKPWEQGVELRGWQLFDQSGTALAEVSSGETVVLRLLWHALERVEHNWTVFVHLVDENGAIVAEHNSIPQGGGFPLPLWTPGDWVADAHPLTLPADLSPGVYTLRVGLYLPWQRDPQQGRRQDVWNVQGEEVGDFADIGVVMVR